MTENQKLREAFSRIRSLITDTTRIDSHTISLVRVECDEALSLPTAAPDAAAKAMLQVCREGIEQEKGNAHRSGYKQGYQQGKKDALALPTAAPVGEQGDYSDLLRRLENKTNQTWFRLRIEAANAIRALEARAALSAGDAVDAQRYRLWRDEYARNAGEEVSDFLIAIANCWIPSEVDAVIDTAMRKDQL